jgi:hypothetical protein
MATDGLSLVGMFAEQQRAINHLRLDCVPPDSSDAALVAVWQAAQTRIGVPITCTTSTPLPMPATTQGHMQTLLAQPWLADRLSELNNAQALMGLPPVTFQYVYIDALLAYQFVVDVDRSNHHCNALSSPPTTAELANLCLPIVQPHEDYFIPPMTPFSNSAIIKLRNHNLQMHRWGVFDGLHGEKVAGVSFWVGLPFVHVTRFNGQCYLHNGYHRTYGARLAGATHVPCIFRDVNNAQAAGILGYDGGTFPETLLTSPNAPRLAHFTQGRGQPVRLREKSRVIHVSWHQYSVPDEYD